MHGCARCGKPVALDVGLCEQCNPLGLRDAAASQVHGTVFIAVALAVVALAVVARLAVSGIGPFPATIDSIRSSGDGLQIGLTVTNTGTASGQTTCRLTEASNRGGGPIALVLSPAVEPAQTLTFSQVVTEFGPDPDIALLVACRTP
jgi:hypothetical protein